MTRGAVALAGLVVLVASGCSGGASDVAPPVATSVDSPPSVGTGPVGTGSAPAAQVPDDDAAVTAVRTYLREQALAVNAGTADPDLVPGLTATLTATGRGWALPLLAENLGDVMPGPYPSGVLTTDRVAEGRVELGLCLQDRGWQVDRTTGLPVNTPHFGTARAVVLRVGDTWLVEDVAADGGECSAADVVEERF